MPLTRLPYRHICISYIYKLFIERNSTCQTLHFTFGYQDIDVEFIALGLEGCYRILKDGLGGYPTTL